ncbi:QacE family quaternary ammonium compound efflux SMR transporter [Anoxybacillus sp. ST70]|uniref:QacE family quaternary ammonium compound efflux SMR transporter n=1 Tax=Anoxybacillus sp. ST70 TaxID=2864180 RepID=UPI0002DD074B|nr:QacE family quaternary ammonium compound efflux SMR transporter [Anoxybacillus sp. ST70]
MYWLYLSVAIIFEVIGTTAMKWSNGLTNTWATIVMFICYGVSFTSLSMALKGIDVSIAYAMWSGLGIVCITFIGLFLFHEMLNFKKIIGVAFVIIGVILLKLK